MKKEMTLIKSNLLSFISHVKVRKQALLQEDILAIQVIWHDDTHNVAFKVILVIDVVKL
jgi:hypothetical protein